jgi:hypothetical protein
MKRVLAILLILSLVTVYLNAEENKNGAVGLVLTNSIAFSGIGGELFLGNLGIGATFTFLPIGGGGDMVLFYEPGAYARFYFGNPASAMYLMGGMSYFTAAGSDSGDSGLQAFDGGILNINGGFGYNSMFGDNNATRFYIEVGPRYTTLVVDSDEEIYAGFFLHFALGFGAAF